MKSSRAVIDPVILYVVGGLLLTQLVPNWRVSHWFKRGPPTAQLTELQAKLEAEQAASKAALAAAEAAKAAERYKLEQQVRAAQQDNAGNLAAIKRVPPAHKTPEVMLAERMATRVNLKLAAAIGKLPEEEQQAMVELIEQALSDKQAEVDEAMRKLAKMDADFKEVTTEREQLKAEIPKLTKRATEAEQAVVVTQAAVTAKTQEVKTWADRTQAALRENGSLWSTLKRGAVVIVGVWAFLTIGIPALVKHLEPGNRLKTPLRDVSGFLMNPLLHWDAKKKLRASKTKPATP